MRSLSQPKTYVVMTKRDHARLVAFMESVLTPAQMTALRAMDLKMLPVTTDVGNLEDVLSKPVGTSVRRTVSPMESLAETGD